MVGAEAFIPAEHADGLSKACEPLGGHAPEAAGDPEPKKVELQYRWREPGIKSFESHVTVLNEDDESTLGVRDFQMRMVLKQEQYARAEKLALKCYDDAVRFDDAARASKVAGRLVTIYEKLGNEPGAARWREQVK